MPLILLTPHFINFTLILTWYTDFYALNFQNIKDTHSFILLYIKVRYATLRYVTLILLLNGFMTLDGTLHASTCEFLELNVWGVGNGRDMRENLTLFKN